MAHDYEYKMIIETLDISSSAQILSRELNTLISGLPKKIASHDNGWKVNSHSIVIHARTALVSILLERPTTHITWH